MTRGHPGLTKVVEAMIRLWNTLIWVGVIAVVWAVVAFMADPEDEYANDPHHPSTCVACRGAAEERLHSNVDWSRVDWGRVRVVIPPRRPTPREDQDFLARAKPKQHP
jgi:hypothetical protein